YEVVASPAPAPEGVDPELREFLREWRRRIAERQGVPAFMVMHDASLDDLCRRQPSTLAELLRVSGFGERKAEAYGQQIFGALDAFRNGQRASAKVEQKVSPAEETMRLLGEGKTLEEIAKIRGRQINTVVGMVAELVEKGRVEFDPAWVPEARLALISEACVRLGVEWLKPLKAVLPEDVTFDEIRLVVARVRRAQAVASE
ncbi:MAG: HRDC domain-containing protein, partial [Bryobacteraceae bacterium]